MIKQFEELLLSTNREGIEALLEFIRKSDFYTAPASTRFHSCHEGGLQKPLALLEELVKTYSNEGDLVVDSCMGSNTTGLACLNLNRRYIGIEKDDEIFEVAKQRVGVQNG